jgi:catechol 2,3-dioxygenase-like lactoylglutathione lyase family enzyme
MISGAHVVLFSKDAEADRAFFRDVLQFPSVDAGHGWLIFALPPAEAAFHPGETNGAHELYLLCTDRVPHPFRVVAPATTRNEWDTTSMFCAGS